MTQPKTLDVIAPELAITLAGLFRERVKRSPDTVAYRYYHTESKQWKNISWRQSALKVAQFQAALRQDGLKPGDRVAIMLRNSPEWVQFEQAALGLGLVVVPLYTNDRIDNVAYVLQDAGVKLILVEGHEQLKEMLKIDSQMDGLTRILSVNACNHYNQFDRLQTLEEWVESAGAEVTANDLATDDGDANSMASIVYTSGTTGRPKGVMLSHANILRNAYHGVAIIPIYTEDLFLSFLPLSHMLERAAGYYIPMTCGASMAFARSVQDLAEDLVSVRPTILISVPRIYERVYNKIYAQLEQKSPFARGLFLKAVEAGWQRFSTGRAPISWAILKPLVANKVMAKLGGRLRVAICGGAALSTPVAKTFIGLGLNLLQGYGLTETSPVIAVNGAKNNDPRTVGHALEGVEIKIGENDELLARGHCVMLGYWNNPTATEAMIDKDAWLHTGDKAKIEDGKVTITGRIKEIIVLSNGEKVPPNDMEMAITLDPMFEQVLVLGEGKPYLSALLVLCNEHLRLLCQQLDIDADDKNVLSNQKLCEKLTSTISQLMHDFPGYAQIKQIAICADAWSVENGLMTPTLKLKRNKIIEKHQTEVDKMYAGH
ncbi:MAG: long-chain fatty acid--CoA ligase [Thiohalomonadales bacterium]